MENEIKQTYEMLIKISKTDEADGICICSIQGLVELVEYAVERGHEKGEVDGYRKGYRDGYNDCVEANLY